MIVYAYLHDIQARQICIYFQAISWFLVILVEGQHSRSHNEDSKDLKATSIARRSERLDFMTKLEKAVNGTKGRWWEFSGQFFLAAVGLRLDVDFIAYI